MNILLIGNGFDLAHGLPTKYSEFLSWVDTFFDLYYEKDAISCEGDTTISYFTEMFNSENDGRKGELAKLLCENVWIKYFEYEKGNARLKENWVDFESEISRVIKSIDEDMYETETYRFDIYDMVDELSNEFFNDYYKNRLLNKSGWVVDNSKANRVPITFAEIRDNLLEDLNKLIRALEIYLSDYVAEIERKYRLVDIKEIEVDKVLSFNYTDTYSRLYDVDNEVDYDYIHGRARLENDMDSDDIVLGINEYLDKDRKNNDLEFVGFKKFFQRIYKETGSKYKLWLDEIHADFNDEKRISREYKDIIPFEDMLTPHRLYIYGHSLDVTDKDILEELIVNDNVYTTIFYYEKTDKLGRKDNGRADLNKKITNLVSVIGQDELIKRTSGITKTIEFRKMSERKHKDIIKMNDV